MKVCYFIQTHTNPEQIYRLVRTIKTSSPQAQILIGHDLTSCELDMAPLQDLSQVNLLKVRSPARRGEFSLLQPYLDAIAWLGEHNIDFDWLVYLSGQDYPTQPLAEVEAFLATSEYDGFIRYWDISSPQSPWGKSQRGFRRYFYQYYRPPTWTHWFLKKISRINNIQSVIHLYFTYGVQLGIRATSVPFNQNFICYGGYQWHTLSKKCVQFIQEFIQQHPELVNYYKKTVCSDESFVQTLLVNNKSFNLCNDNKRYFDHTGSRDGHPRILTTQDYSIITSGSFHFARKFDLAQDSKILEMLDAKVLQKNMTALAQTDDGESNSSL